MLITLISFFLLLFYFSSLGIPVFADDFNIIGDSNFNQYRQATTISIGTLPQSPDDSFSISYDPELIAGYSTQQVFEELTIEDLTEMNYWKRIPGIADNVSGPPGTEIDVSYFFFNLAGHGVEVSKVVIPFSQEVPEDGNWLNIVSVNNPLPLQRSISIFWDKRNLTKSGLLKEYIGPGVLEDGVVGSLLLDKLTIADPIQVSEVESEIIDDNVSMKVVIKNIGTEELENLQFKHLDYNHQFTISPSQEITIEYILEDVQDLGHFQIENSNEQTECAIYGIKKYQWVRTEGITALAFREDGGWVNGSYIIPEQESFCITRVPYTLVSPFLGYANTQLDDNIKEDIEEEGEIPREDLEEVGENEPSEELLEVDDELEKGGGVVLGVQGGVENNEEVKQEDGNNFVLPKTGVVR
jgi:hypothetical protein